MEQAHYVMSMFQNVYLTKKKLKLNMVMPVRLLFLKDEVNYVYYCVVLRTHDEYGMFFSFLDHTHPWESVGVQPPARRVRPRSAG